MGEYLNIGYARKLVIQKRRGEPFTIETLGKMISDLGGIYSITDFIPNQALLTLDENLYKNNVIPCSVEFYEKLVDSRDKLYLGKVFSHAKECNYTYESLLENNRNIGLNFEGSYTALQDVSYIFNDMLSIRAYADVAIIFSEGKAMFEAYEDSFSIIRNMLHMCLINPLAKALVVSLG